MESIANLLSVAAAFDISPPDPLLSLCFENPQRSINRVVTSSGESRFIKKRETLLQLASKFIVTGLNTHTGANAKDSQQRTPRD